MPLVLLRRSLSRVGDPRYLGVLAVFAGLALVASASTDALRNEFLHPPASAKPRTFWLWMNGNVTRDGITRDLEAMQRVGIGGVMTFDGSTYLPAGPVSYLKPEWRELMTHAIKEGNRLGVQFGMHNAPGWSSSGGPWVTPEMSMQQLVSTETTVQGGKRVQVQLARPQANAGYYADARVIAFPALEGESVRYEDTIRSARAGNEKVADISLLSDGRLDSFLEVKEGGAIVIEFNQPQTFHALTAFPAKGGRFPAFEVEGSVDGNTFTAITRFSGAGHHGIIAPSARSFQPTTVRFVRLVPSRSGAIGEFVLHRSPRVAGWPVKANYDYRVGGQLSLPAENPPGVDPRAVVDVSRHVSGDTLTWDAPPGAWTVLRVGHTTTEKHNVASSAAGRGLEIDKFNPAAAEFHFQHVIERVAADAAAAGAKGPATILIDSYEAGLQNWTAHFPQEFERRAGYDIVPYLPALFGRIVGDAHRTERFLFDFRRVQADLMAENYYEKMRDLTLAQGMRFYVEGYGVSVFDELRVAGSPEIPTTEFWTRTPWTPNRSVKMVTSAAHVYGKPIVAAEAFTGEMQTSRWLEYPYALKILGDEMLAHGVNEFVFHRYAHQPHPDAVPGMTMGPYGFHFDRTNTWFEHATPWLSYITRTQNILRNGTYVADILYYTGERAPDQSSMAMPVLPPGYTYDLINTDVLLNRVSVRDGRFVLPEGGSYRLLVLPPDLKAMRPELAGRIRGFVESGAVVMGPKPGFSPTLRGYPESEQAMLADADAAWSLLRQRHGRTQEWNSNAVIGDALHALDVQPDFSFTAETPDAAFSWQHRKLEDGADLYFIGNRQRRVETLVASFRGQAGRQPEIWRTETGAVERLALFDADGDRARVPLRLEPGESVFVVFRSEAKPVAGEITLDGSRVLSTRIESAKPGAASQDFAMSVWVKPDTDLRAMPREGTTGRIDEVGKFYAIPADPGDLRFGEGHATAGLAVGRNGIFVVERASDSCPAVLVAAMSVSGWTHVAVVYRGGTPSLFVNGKLVKEGLKSGKIVHSGVGSPPPPVDYVLHFPGIESLSRAANQPPPPSRGNVFFFEGNLADARTLPANVEWLDGIVAAGVPRPPLPTVTELQRNAGGRVTARAWKSGKYEIAGIGTARASVQPPVEIAGGWRVQFQAGRGAPAAIDLPKLASLHLHADAGVRFFSGTATYVRDVEIPSAFLAPGRRVVLDLGRVEVIAGIRVNGKDVGTAWKEPYRLDVTDFVQAGTNRLEIAVANLWTNRLIGDEHLPAEDEFGILNEQGADPHGITKLPQWYREGKPKPPGGRITFATWKFYDRNEPLVASGLLGPVRILNPVEITFER